MSVNSKMTAIADRIRELVGINSKMGLDAMAEYLETEKANIDDAYAEIKNKGGTVPSSQVTGNLAAAISSIPDAPKVMVAAKNGSVTVNGSDTSVDLGWKPDAVFFRGTNIYYNTAIHAGVEFKETNVTSMDTYFAAHEFGYILSIFTVTQTETGFKVRGVKMNTSADFSNEHNRVVEFVAVKYS